MVCLTLASNIEDVIGLSIPVLLILGIFSFVILRTIVQALRDTRIRREIECSRREIAAYVAEGSITPEEARRLLEADPPNTAPRG